MFKVLIFFPRISTQSAFTPLHIVRKFYDELFYPSLQEILDTHDLSNWPCSYSMVQNWMKIGSSKAKLHQPLTHRHTTLLWELILEKIKRNQGGNLEIFEDTFLYLYGLNLKNIFFGKTIKNVIFDTKEFLRDIILFDEINWEKSFIDIGMSITPSKEDAKNGICLLWKTCCVENWFNTANIKRRTRYRWCQTRDSSNIVSELSENCSLGKEGVRYVQHYNTLKKVYRATNKIPLEDIPIEMLVYSKTIISQLRRRSSGRGADLEKINESFHRDIHSLLKNFEAIKSHRKSYGIRCEIRIKWIAAEYFEEKGHQLPHEFSINDPKPFYSISTEAVSNFIIGLVNLYTSIFNSYVQKNSIKVNETAFALLMTPLLRGCFGNYMMEKHSVIMKDNIERGDDIIRGLYF